MRVLFFLFLIVSFNGCSIFPYEENFACENMNEFGQCIGVNGAYEYATTGKKTGVDIAKKGKKNNSKQDTPIIPTVPSEVDQHQSYQVAVYQRLSKLVSDPKMPIVKQPEVMRTLILDYSDGEHISRPLYSHRFIYFLGSEPEWVMDPYKVRSDAHLLPTMNDQ